MQQRSGANWARSKGIFFLASKSPLGRILTHQPLSASFIRRLAWPQFNAREKGGKKPDDRSVKHGKSRRPSHGERYSCHDCAEHEAPLSKFDPSKDGHYRGAA